MDRYSGNILILISTLAFGMSLTACEARTQLPAAAFDALQQTWRELEMTGKVRPEIIRAWQGDMSKVTAGSSESTPEIWCVEAKQVLNPNPVSEADTLIWIVVRSDDQSEWGAALLMTMSSIWAYEACGVFD